MRKAVPHQPSPITLVGHPFAPIGMGEHVRGSFRSLRSVGVTPGLIDIYGLNKPEPEARDEFGARLVSTTGPLNVFHINGDEVEQALAALAHRPGPADSYNIIYPTWELSRYPASWARELEHFDEVWAPSRFIAESITAAVDRPVIHMPLACEVVVSSFLERRWFGIAENSFTFLFFFDLRSYASRKNPQAVITAFRKLTSARPYSECTLVLKINGAETSPETLRDLRESLDDLRDRVVFIDRTLTDNEIKNLVRNCDCFVSLHRSEGFGFGLCEAMYLGKPVIGTAYSGNMDFMTTETARLVDYTLVPVARDAYPHWESQVWAHADVDHAVRHMVAVVDDPRSARALGARASLHIRTHFGYRAAGVRYSERISEIRRISDR